MPRYNENFINIRLSSSTVYIYSVRKLLQKAIDRNIDTFHGVLLDLGCGEMPYKRYLIDRNKNITKYIGVDIDSSQYHQSVKPDMHWDGKKIEIENEKVNTVLATELFEHLPNIENVISEIYRVLVRDGCLFFTIPFVWPLHETPHDEYRYTPYSLERFLKNAGFRDIKIVPLGGYNAALAQMICIWIGSRHNETSSKLKNKLFEKTEKYILYPVIKKLLRRDNDSSINSYGESTMPTGFYGYAKK
jgi:SAM-dependent methyltransferase